MAKDIGTILEEAAVVRDETLKEANTADRVGGVLADIAEYVRGSTFAQGVTIEASASAVTIRLKRADESGTSYYENVTLPAVSSSKAGVMTPTQVATLLQHTVMINTQKKEIETVSTAVEKNTAAIATNTDTIAEQGKAITVGAEGVKKCASKISTNEVNIAKNTASIAALAANFKNLGSFTTSAEGEAALATYENVFGATAVFLTYTCSSPNARSAFAFQTIKANVAYQCLMLGGSWHHRTVTVNSDKTTTASAWADGIA